MNDKQSKIIWVIVGSITTLAIVWVCIQVAFSWLTYSTPYPIPTEFRCDPQPFPTTTAEITRWEWKPLPLSINDNRYDFVAGACDAAWFTGMPETRIPCSGNANDPYGMVISINQPNVEDNGNYSSALWVRPSPEYCWGEGDLRPTKHQPYVEGLYGCIDIDLKDRFHARIGCLKDNPNCDVTFKVKQVYYSQGNVLGEWREVYDGTVTEVDLDLSDLVNQCVIFSLEVESNTLDVENANAIWISPEIIKAK